MKSNLEKIIISDFEAVIFDMDGLLVDSEPLWQEAEIEVFSTIGIELTIDDCLKTTGLPTKDVLEYWFKIKPWTNKSLDQVSNELTESVKLKIMEKGRLMPYALDLLEYLKSKNIKIGLASASPLDIISLSLNSLNVVSYFDFYHSSNLELRNKPFPDVYWAVAKKMNVNIKNCIVLEDSINGIKGAIASGAYAIAVPDSHFFNYEYYDNAKHKLKHLGKFLDLIN